MKKINLMTITLLMFCLALLGACGSGGGGNGGGNPNGGFTLLATRAETSQTTGTTVFRPTIMRVQGQFLEPQGPIRGTLESFLLDIGPVSFVANAKVPAKWRFTYFELPGPFPPCRNGIQTVERNVRESEELVCDALVFPIAVSPSIIDGQNSPANIEIQADGASDQYGAPQVAILSEFGQVMAVRPGTIIHSKKGNLSIEAPNFAQYPSGTYQLTVSNIRADGSWDVIGAGEIRVYGNTPPDPPDPQNPPDPCAVPAPCMY